MSVPAGRSFWGGSVSAQKKTDGCGDYGCEDDTASSRSGHGEKKREQSCRNCRGELQSVATQGEKQSKKHGRPGQNASPYGRTSPIREPESPPRAVPITHPD